MQGTDKHQLKTDTIRVQQSWKLMQSTPLPNSVLLPPPRDKEYKRLSILTKEASPFFTARFLIPRKEMQGRGGNKPAAGNNLRVFVPDVQCLKYIIPIWSVLDCNNIGTMSHTTGKLLGAGLM